MSNFEVNTIPGGIHIKYAETSEHQFVIVYGLDVSVGGLAGNKFERYNIKTGHKVPKKNRIENNYYSNINGYKFEVKPGMCSARVSSANNAVLFHNNIDGNYHIYQFDGTYVDMIDGKKIYSEYDMDRIRRFEFHKTYSLLYSESEDLTVVIYDHINKQSKEFVCGEWQLFRRIVHSRNTLEDLYMYIEHDESCDLITVNWDNPSNFETESNTYKFSSENCWKYFITSIDDDPVLVAVDGYHVEIREITSELPLIKSFNLKNMAAMYAYFDNEAGGFPIKGTHFMETFANNAAENFICINKGKLYYNKSDGFMPDTDKNEYMAIDLSKIDESGEYTPIPLFDLISDEGKELIATHYSDHTISELRVLENQYIIEYPDNKFIVVDMR
jgi:hypothetical protein